MISSRVTVLDLRKALKARGLTSHGNKRELIARCHANGVAVPLPGGSISTVPPTEARTSMAPPSPARLTPGPVTGGPRTTVEGVTGGLGAAASPLALASAAGPTSGSLPGSAMAAALAPPSHIGGVPLLVMAPPVVGHLPAASSHPVDELASAPAVSAAAGATPSDTVPGAGPVGGRSPVFTMHEMARLAHVMSKPEVAAGVVVSRGPMSRKQQDARKKRAAVWTDVVATVFNGDSMFVIPQAAADQGFDPCVHPHQRSGERLQTKWSEVRVTAYYRGVLACWDACGGGSLCDGRRETLWLARSTILKICC